MSVPTVDEHWGVRGNFNTTLIAFRQTDKTQDNNHGTICWRPACSKVEMADPEIMQRRKFTEKLTEGMEDE